MQLSLFHAWSCIYLYQDRLHFIPGSNSFLVVNIKAEVCQGHKAHTCVEDVRACNVQPEVPYSPRIYLDTNYVWDGKSILNCNVSYGGAVAGNM